jgi:DNA-binding MarR family transcriptional regulator
MTPDGDREPHDELIEVLSVRLDNFERHVAGHLVGWLQKCGLSTSELQVLLALADGESREGGELAKASGVPVDLTYPALHKLAAYGWLHEENRRHFLSAAGQDKVHELSTVRRAAVADFVSSLSVQERRDLAVGLGVTSA